MNLHRHLGLGLILAMLPVFSTPAVGAASLSVADNKDLQDCAQYLAVKLTSQLGGAARKVAVTNLVKLNEADNLLGAQLAEELTTALFQQNKQITLVERRRLQAAISELRLSSGDLFDESNARRIGKFVGADAVVIGSLFAANEINVVVRVIKVETGDVLAAASTTLAATEEYKKALDKPLWKASAPSPTAAALLTTPNVTDPGPPAGDDRGSPKTVFSEDFKAWKEGTAPDKWLGTEHFAVTYDKRGKPLFKAFEPGASRFSISGIDFPRGDFAVEWIVSRNAGTCRSQPHMLVTIGNLTAGAEHTGCGSYAAVLNNSRGAVAVAAGTPHRFELRREGAVFTLWMDGTRLLLARKTDFSPGDTLVINMDQSHRDLNSGILYAVKIIENR